MKTNHFAQLLRYSGLTAGVALLLWHTPTAKAQTTAPMLYQVTIDTSQLANHPAGAFALQFTLYAGSGTGDGNSTVLVTNFNFSANGLADSVPDLDGGVSGNLSTNVTMTDTSVENDFAEEFTPGNTLSFAVQATLTLATNGVSDELEIALVDSGGERIPTLDTNEDNSLVRLTTSDGVSINVESYSTDPSIDPVASGPPVSFGPLVLLNGATAPTPPAIGMAPGTNGTLTIQWPSLYSNFTLQETTDLINWSPAPIEAATVGTNNTVVVYTSGAPYQFYRLAQ